MKVIIREELRAAVLMCSRINECRGSVCSTQRRYERLGYDTLCVNPRDHSEENAVESVRKVLKLVDGIKS